MKRSVGMALMLLLIFAATCAVAQPVLVGDARRMEQGYYDACTQLENEMPQEIADVFASYMREGDTVISGTYVVEHNPRVEGGVFGESAVLAVEREGHVLLMGACKAKGVWNTTLETDNFIPSGCAFTITYLPEEYGDEGNIRVRAGFAITMNGKIWRIAVSDTGTLHMESCEWREADGTRVIIEARVATMAYCTVQDGKYATEEHGHCSFSSRLTAWSMEAYPQSLAQMRAYIEENQPRLEPGLAYISGVNLREQPTGKSRSRGEYSARVQVLGSEPGTQAPWYHVRLGDTEGWVSGDYLIDGSQYDVRYFGTAAMTAAPARANGDVALRRAPDGESKLTLSAGTMMHVLAERDGWLHVIVPRGAITAHPDWDGTYGYVRASEVTQGKTLTELRWR